MERFYERLIVSARIKAIGVGMLITTTLFAQGELIDGRDGNVYKTITIGNQVWMAENLRFDNGKYTWTVAQDVCPGGWHLPSQEELEYAIEKAKGARKIELQNFAKEAKKKGKSINVRCVRDFLLVSQYGRRVGE
jgi:hypothetical protein